MEVQQEKNSQQIVYDGQEKKETLNEQDSQHQQPNSIKRQKQEQGQNQIIIQTAQQNLSHLTEKQNQQQRKSKQQNLSQHSMKKQHQDQSQKSINSKKQTHSLQSQKKSQKSIKIQQEQAQIQRKINTNEQNRSHLKEKKKYKKIKSNQQTESQNSIPKHDQDQSKSSNNKGEQKRSHLSEKNLKEQKIKEQNISQHQIKNEQNREILNKSNINTDEQKHIHLSPNNNQQNQNNIQLQTQDDYQNKKIKQVENYIQKNENDDVNKLMEQNEQKMKQQQEKVQKQSQEHQPQNNLQQQQQQQKDSQAYSQQQSLQQQQSGSEKPYQQQKQDIYQNQDPMSQYLRKQNQILQWYQANNRQKQWIDYQFPADFKQFWNSPNTPTWAQDLKKVEWKRPKQLNKDAKFMDKVYECDCKQGSFSESWFIGALTIIAAKGDYLEKLIIQKDHFDKGFVSFQFFKNGKWTQVIVDTLLPYQKQINTSSSVYSACANPQQFWIQLMQKAYCKLHGCYQKIIEGSILEGLVDLTAGVSQFFQLDPNTDQNLIWNTMISFFSQKFYIGCIFQAPSIFDQLDKPTKAADQGISGILQNHYYSLIDIKDFIKQGLKLIRIRNPYGSDGVWTGAFSDDSQDWDKHRVLRDQLKKSNPYPSKKSDSVWWMNFSDWCTNYSKIIICKVFPQSWQNYSIEGYWKGKTYGGACPKFVDGKYEDSKNEQMGIEKSLYFEQFKKSKLMKQSKLFRQDQQRIRRPKRQGQFIQQDTDDRWFNNPQYKIKVFKDTKVYMTLTQEDQKLNGPGYIPVNFMVIANHNPSNRIWQRPTENDIIIEANVSGEVQIQRQLTTYMNLKRFEEKKYGVFMVIPNVLELSNKLIQSKRIFYLRIFSSEKIELSQMPQTIQISEDGSWGQNTAGGSRKVIQKIDKNQKGEKLQKPTYVLRDNPNWCMNPQYFLNLQRHTHLKIILRRSGPAKKLLKGVKIGLTICRFQTKQSLNNNTQKISKTIVGNNLQRLLQQTNQQLQPPIMENIKRKLNIGMNQKFKQSTYASEDYAALYFNWNPTQGPFIIIPSQDIEGRLANFKLTIFSNNPVQLQRLDDNKNKAIIGKWQQKLSDGGSHLNQKLWINNPKYLVQFKEHQQQADLQMTLSIAEKNWKKNNKNTVKGMIGLYLLEKRQGKLSIEQIIEQTSFLPMNEICMRLPYRLGTNGKALNKGGYLIMPTTFEPDIRGKFILSVNSDKQFSLQTFK